MRVPASGYKRVLEALLRWWVLVAVFFLVLGQVSLNRDNPEEALLAQPAFRFRAASLAPLDFSVGGKIANLVYPAAGLWLLCAAGGAFRKRPALLPPVLGFLLAAAVSCAFSPLSRLSWETGVKPLLTATIFFVLVATAFGPEVWRRRLLVAVFGAMILTAAAGLALYLRRIYFPQTDQRIWLSFGHPNSTGAVMIPAITIVAAYLMTSAPAKIKLACVLTLPVLAATMVFTFSRTAWISLLLALGVLVFWAGTRKFKAVFLGAVLLAVGALVWGVNVGPQSYWKARVRSLAGWREDPNVQRRQIYWEAAGRMLARRPLVGCGPGYRVFMESYRRYFQRVDTGELVTGPHNGFLSIGAGMGALGLAAFLWLIAAVVGLLGSHRDPGWLQRGFRMGLGAGLLGFLVGNLTDDPLLNDRILCLVWVFLGILAAGEAGSGLTAPPLSPTIPANQGERV